MISYALGASYIIPMRYRTYGIFPALITLPKEARRMRCNRGRRQMFKKEKRVCPRAELSWPVSAKVGAGSMKGETKNISTQGAYVCCHKPLKLNKIFDMLIDTPDKTINIKAEVVWSNRYGPEDKTNPRGMGVRFIEISEEDRRLIAQKLDQCRSVKAECDFMDTVETQIVED